MAGMRAEKSLQCRNLAIDRYDSFYIKICSAFDLIIFYKGGAGKDFFSSQTCHFRLLIVVFGLIGVHALCMLETHYKGGCYEV